MPEGDPGREKYQWSEKDFPAKYQEEGEKNLSTRLQPALPLSVHQGLHWAGGGCMDQPSPGEQALLPDVLPREQRWVGL